MIDEQQKVEALTVACEAATQCLLVKRALVERELRRKVSAALHARLDRDTQKLLAAALAPVIRRQALEAAGKRGSKSVNQQRPRIALPIVRQRDENSCGPACLASVIAWFEGSAGTKHLPGQHDQADHGRGGAVRETERGEALGQVSRGEDKVWRYADGTEAPEHVQKLGIPPAWTSVWVNDDPSGDLMAVGTDSKGKEQYRYSSNHEMQAAADKFGRVSELRNQRRIIYREIAEDIRTGNNREKAEALELVMRTGMRPGSNSDTKAAHKSYGATTLEGRHVVDNGDGTVTIRFVPGKKKGGEIEMPVTNKRLAASLLRRAGRAGPDGRLFDTSAGSLRNYSKKMDGGGFKTKDHRTALGTETAVDEIKSRKSPTSPEEYKQAVKEVSAKVAEVLGNTPSIAFKSYVDPQVWVKWKRKAGVK